MKNLLVALFLSFLMVACSAQRVKTPSICDQGSPKLADLQKWSKDTYRIQIADGTTMLLCEIANDRNIHLEATGDLLMLVDSAAVRADVFSKYKAIAVFQKLRSTFLAAAEGALVIKSGDIYDMVARYAGQYPEIGIVMQYTNVFRLPEYSKRFPTVADFMSLVWWCNQNIDLLGRI